MLHNPVFRFIWFLLGTIFLVLGFVGIALPVLPTVPFILLSAFCYANSSERMYQWLLNHKIFGPMIRDWRERGAISRPSKWIATISMIGAWILQYFLTMPFWLLASEALIFLCVLIFIWTRPE